MEKLYKSMLFLWILMALNGSVQAHTGIRMTPFFTSSSDQGNTLEVFPNPATVKATLGYRLSGKSTVTIRVIDLSGRQIAVILNKQVLAAGQYETDLEFAKYRIMPGMYIVHMLVDKQSVSRKLIVQ